MAVWARWHSMRASAQKKLPASNFLVDGETARLSKDGNFVGRHIYVPLEGVAIQINAYNFPSWGMLEKLAPSFLAGMPTIVKPASPSAWLTFRIVEILVGSGIVPEGALQLISGSVGDLFNHLTCQDVVAFTGSASTGEKIRSHPTIVHEAVRVNIEADSLNCILLGPDVAPGSETFEYFAKEVVREMTVKAGQKCTAIRRVIVAFEQADAVADALKERLAKIQVGDPKTEGVRMGPLVDEEALRSAREGVAKLSGEAEIIYGDPSRKDFEPRQGVFMEPVLLLCQKPLEATAIHEVEVFGPAATVMTYSNVDEAIELARKGGGSLVGSIFSEDEDFITKTMFGLAPYHGRLMVMNAKAAPESTGARRGHAAPCPWGPGPRRRRRRARRRAERPPLHAAVSTPRRPGAFGQTTRRRVLVGSRNSCGFPMLREALTLRCSARRTHSDSGFSLVV